MLTDMNELIITTIADPKYILKYIGEIGLTLLMILCLS